MHFPVHLNKSVNCILPFISPPPPSAEPKSRAVTDRREAGDLRSSPLTVLE